MSLPDTVEIHGETPRFHDGFHLQRTPPVVISHPSPHLISANMQQEELRGAADATSGARRSFHRGR